MLLIETRRLFRGMGFESLRTAPCTLPVGTRLPLIVGWTFQAETWGKADARCPQAECLSVKASRGFEAQSQLSRHSIIALLPR